MNELSNPVWKFKQSHHFSNKNNGLSKSFYQITHAHRDDSLTHSSSTKNVCHNRIKKIHTIWKCRKQGISEWAGFQVWKFLHPKGCKKPLNQPTGRKAYPPKGRRPAGGKPFPSQGLILRFFTTRGMKKFPYLKPTAHSENLFLLESTWRSYSSLEIHSFTRSFHLH